MERASRRSDGSIWQLKSEKFVKSAGGVHLVATEALSIAFNTGLERIELEVFASNTVAKKLCEKFGFHEEGRKRKARKLDGVYDDIVLFGLLREERLR